MSATNTTVEILYPDSIGATGSAFHDITSDALTRDSIFITGGRADESRRISPSTLNLTLDNTDGKYSPRNPLSPLYGLIGRNTPIRVSSPSVTDTFTRSVSGSWGTPDVGPAWTGSGSQFSVNGSAGLMSHSGSGILVQTSGVIAANLDIYVDIDPATPAGTGNAEYTIRTRVTNSGNNYIEFMAFGVQASAPTLAVREFVSGSQVQLSGFPSISGVAAGAPFRLHLQLTGNTARLRGWAIGATEPTTWAATITNFNATNTGAGQVTMRSSIPGGWTNTPPIVTSFDNFTLRSFRFTGEVESWPQCWDVSGTDVYVPLTANGITRRLNAPGATRPALSALYRTLSPQSSNLLGWWPLENVTPEMTSAPSALTNGTAATITDGSVSRTTDGSFPGADVVPKTGLGVGAAVGATNYGTEADPIPLLASTGDSWSLLFWTRTQLTEDAESTTTVTATVKVSGSPQIDTWFFSVRQNNFTVAARVEVNAFAVNTAGSVVTAVSFASGVTADYVDAWRAIRVNVDLSGSDHRLRVWLDETLLNTVTAASNTPGQPSSMAIQAQVTTSPVPVSIGHILFSGGTGSDYIDTNATTLVSAGTGYAGDTASARMTRLCSEEGVSFTVDSGTSEAVGVQRVAPFLDLMFDAADADGGILYEPRSSLGLEYRTQYSLYNQAVAGTLDYSAGGEVAPDLRPVDDTDATGNDIVVTRYNGGSARAIKTTGTLNVQEPPAGVGRYRKDVTLVLYQDSQALQQAAWLRHLGTWDEARYPIINVDLLAMRVDSKTTLHATALSLQIGDRLSITNPPAWLPPDSIEQRIQGYREEIGSHRQTIAFNATPAGPYDVLELETSTTDNLSRIPAGVTTLNEALDTTETGVDIISVTARWIDSATYSSQFPFDILIGGERMTVTALTGTGLTQTMTVTRSVNGVVKTHVSGTAVQLFRPPVIAR